MDGAMDKLIGPLLKKYEVPEWVSPYVYQYIKGDPVNAVKRAISFIDVRRKKGEVTKKSVRLPNGTVFDTKAIMALLGDFFYIEERMAKIMEAWLNEKRAFPNQGYSDYFDDAAERNGLHARAIKSVISGFGGGIAKPKKHLVSAFDYVETLDPWPERLVASEIVLKGAYSTFGIVFYKIFYPASPELIRSLSKVFVNKEKSGWEVDETRRLITEGILSNERMITIAEDVLSRVSMSIEDEMPLAKKLGIGREVLLLEDISLANPLHALAEMGGALEPDEEVKRIKALAKRL